MLLVRPVRHNRLNKRRTKNGAEVLARIENYLKGNQTEPIQLLCGFWKNQQDAITYQEIREVVIAGVISKEILRLWSQDYSYLVANQFKGVWEKAVVGGSFSQPIMDGLDFEFNTQTLGVLRWITERGAEFVTSCTAEQKDAMAALLSKKMIEGHTVDELSRLIRPCIGLTAGQAKANAKYYDNIVANLRKEHPRMKMDSIRKKALDAAQKYAERQHRERAMNIAQTEMAFAYNRGADEGVRQAQTHGLLGSTIKRWSTSGDDAVCAVCNALDGVEIGMEEDFEYKGKVLFQGHHRLPPAHPKCACAVEYVEVDKLQINSVRNRDYVLETSNGLSAGDGNNKVPEHNPPEYLGSLDDLSDDVIKSTLERYEMEIADSEIENAIVISKSGLVWRCYGDKESVFPNIDLGEQLQGAWLTHNHPVGSRNEYSFSKQDIDLFMDNSLEILRGIDEKYIYELNRNPKDIAVHVSIFEIDDYSARHDAVISSAEKLGIGYRRYPRGE